MAVDTTEPVSEGAEGADWAFARRPFWVFSHLFVLAAIVVFVNLGLWQLRRLDDRRATNAEIEAVMDAPVITLYTATDIDGLPTYHPVVVSGRLVEPDLARVVNRSQWGVAGEHVVGIVQLDDGSRLAINRGFVALGDDRPLPGASGDPVTVGGWVRNTVEQERFGATDQGTSPLMPRFNTAMVAERLGSEVPSNWLQVAPDLTLSTPAFPDPVPLPPLTDGPHLSYALQWFAFSIMTVLFYGAMLRREARRPVNPPQSEIDGVPLVVGGTDAGTEM